MIRPLQFRWASTDSAHRFEVFDPATGAVLETVQGGGAAEIDAAVRAAHEGFKRWRQRPAKERAQYLRAAGQILRAHADELAALETRENGKPLAQSRFMDMEACIGSFAYFADQIEALEDRTTRIGAIDSIEMLEPFGVIGGIIPFNWPPIHFAAKAAPALAAGNAIVLKPGEQAPLTILRLTELVASALPDNVIHVVPGLAEAGQALAAHPLVRKISFTGAPTTGVHVLKAAADNLTPALMELGGKNPFIIFADADIDRAAQDAIEGAFVNKGEACTAASRILVERAAVSRVTEIMAGAVRKLRLGNGLDRTTHVGPVVSAAQKARVEDYIAIALGEGATIAAQSALPADPALSRGYFVPPTLFTDVLPTMRIAREEIFGPVTCIIPFDSYDEAIAIANDVEFGLVSAVYTKDEVKASRAVRDIEAGMVMINNYNRNFMGSAFGGMKASGFGREHCIHTLGEFGYLKTVRKASSEGEIMRWNVLSELF